MSKREIYDIGQTVYFGGSKELKGEIEAVMLYPNHEEYRVFWWNDQDRKTIWLRDTEFTPKKPEKVTLGFNK